MILDGMGDRESEVSSDHRTDSHMIIGERGSEHSVTRTACEKVCWT